MTSPLSQEEARDALRKVASPASNPEDYSAARAHGGGGWSFHRIGSEGQIGGPPPIVVTDEGTIGRLKLGETIDKAITRVSQQTNRADQTGPVLDV